jgi:hypothetical protein
MGVSAGPLRVQHPLELLTHTMDPEQATGKTPIEIFRILKQPLSCTRHAAVTSLLLNLRKSR